MMEITVNGKVEQVSQMSIQALVTMRNLDTRALVIEYNGRVVAAEQWPETMLAQGDRLELLSFVGGG